MAAELMGQGELNALRKRTEATPCTPLNTVVADSCLAAQEQLARKQEELAELRRTRQVILVMHP